LEKMSRFVQGFSRFIFKKRTPQYKSRFSLKMSEKRLLY
jgi:hypothetical protein